MSNMAFRVKVEERGQALVTLLIFVAVALIVSTAAIGVALVSTQASSQFTQGEQAYDIAESGAEDAILKLERNSSFATPASGYDLAVGSGIAQVIVTPPGLSSTKTIISRGVVNNRFKRKVQVVGQFSADGTFSVVSWNEIDD